MNKGIVKFHKFILESDDFFDFVCDTFKNLKVLFNDEDFFYFELSHISFKEYTEYEVHFKYEVIGDIDNGGGFWLGDTWINRIDYNNYKTIWTITKIKTN